MLSILLVIIKIVILLGFLVLIHELGHFSVAKLCKVRVNEFSIGFGPILLKKQGKETKYELRAIPLGGFVSMEGEEEQSEKEGSFSKASIPKRIAIVIAGACVNILFGLLVYFIISASTGPYLSNVIDSTIDGYSAQSIGLQSDDKIIKINDKKIKNKYDLDKAMSHNNGEKINLKIQREGNIINYEITPTEVKNKVTGIYLNDTGKIVSVEKGSTADEQGLKSNDQIISINNKNIDNDSKKAIEIIKEIKNQETFPIVVKRDNAEIKVKLTPKTISTYYLGVNMRYADDNFKNRCINGGIETKTFILEIGENLKQLFVGKVGLDQMMGPVGISEAVAKTNGIKEFFQMMALISVSLGVTNLLPIPALDGGKILLLIIEAIRRKPINSEIEMNLQLIGFAILITLSLIVTYNDILRIG